VLPNPGGYFTSSAAIMPEISATWAHNFLDPAVAIRQSFVAAQNASFLIRGEDPSEDSFLPGVGLSYHPNASDELFIRYGGDGPRMTSTAAPSAPAEKSAGRSASSRPPQHSQDASKPRPRRRPGLALAGEIDSRAISSLV
jgi:hypothetical protein